MLDAANDEVGTMTEDVRARLEEAIGAWFPRPSRDAKNLIYAAEAAYAVIVPEGSIVVDRNEYVALLNKADRLEEAVRKGYAIP